MSRLECSFCFWSVVPSSKVLFWSHNTMIELKLENHSFHISIWGNISKIRKCWKNIGRNTTWRHWFYRWKVRQIHTTIINTIKVYRIYIFRYITWDNCSNNLTSPPCQGAFETSFTMSHPNIYAIICLTPIPCLDNSASPIWHCSKSKSLKKNMRPKIIRLWSRNHTSKYWSTTGTMCSISIETLFSSIVSFEVETLIRKRRIIGSDYEFLRFCCKWCIWRRYENKWADNTKIWKESFMRSIPYISDNVLNFFIPRCVDFSINTEIILKKCFTTVSKKRENLFAKLIFETKTINRGKKRIHELYLGINLDISTLQHCMKMFEETFESHKKINFIMRKFCAFCRKLYI